MPTAFALVVLAHCLDYCRIGVRRVEIVRSTTSGYGAIKIASLGAVFSFIGFSHVPRSRATLSAILTADLRFNLAECVRAMLRGDCHELPAVRVAAIDFVQTAGRIAGPTDDGSTCENIVDERSRLGAVKQAGARFNFQSNSHDPLSFIDGARDQTDLS
jgi:hypothetical protein